MSRREPVLLAWSSGKDSAWSLHILKTREDVEVVGLLTTLNEGVDRVAVHAVRRVLAEPRPGRQTCLSQP
jgi:diphthamide synthase (EF-2-diphthine--ammonia ligase)